jgi:hypothetical protein
MVMTNVSKPIKKKYISIDTKYCDEYVNNRLNTGSTSTVIQPTYNIAKYTFTLSQKITDVKSISVANVEVPNTLYNISAAMGNNYFAIVASNSATVNLITIPDGIYTASNIASAINTVITAVLGASPPLSYTLSSTSNYSGFSNSSSSVSYTLQFAVTPTGTADKYNFKSKLGWFLGFRNITYTVRTNGSIASESIVNINNKKYVYLAVDEYATTYQNSFLTSLPFSSISKNIIAKIQLDTRTWPFGYMIPANAHIGSLMSDTRAYSGKVDIQKLGIQLLDEDGNPVNLNGQDFSFGLVIDYE